MRLYPLSIIIVCGILDPASTTAGTLQIFSGTLTEITCSAAVPAFRLVKQEMQYGPEDYDKLPDLFEIEAILSPNRDNVTLYINGTNRSNNVTVMCRNVDAFTGQFQILFTLILGFVSILPPPNDVHYIEGPAGYIQIAWEPPTLFSDELGSQNNIRLVDSRITHFIIYITTKESTIVYNALGTSFTIENDNITCSLSFQVAAVNPAGVGECSPPQIIDWCRDYTSLTTVTVIEPAPASSGLLAGEITAIIIAVVLMITACISVVSAIIFAKLKNNRHTQSLNSAGLSGDQLSDPKNSLPEIEKCVESGHCSSDNDHVDKKQQSASESTQRERNYSQGGPPIGLYYAEIDVITKRQNKVPEPSSVEDASRHEYAVLEQSNQITDTDHDHPD